jgi:glycosyltransferase involved in cell wall biosynthesis
MQAILLSNIAHYHHLAQALHSGGYLKRYITAPALLEGKSASRWMSRRMRTKFEGRRLNGLPEDKVRQIYTAEVVQRLLPALRLSSRERADWVNNHLFDKLARHSVDTCDVFHFVSGVGLYCAKKARKNDALIVCDVRQEHPAFQRRILEEEAAIQGVPVRITGRTYEDKVLREFELADRIVVPSQHARRTFLSQGFADGMVTVVPYGVDLDVFRPGDRRSDDGELKDDGVLKIVYAGSLTIRKGAQYLLEAVKAMGRRAELTIAGPLDPDFKPVLAQYEGHFQYLGPVPKLELQALYVSSSVFVLPSLADSFSLATLEAMACGTPVIVTENTGAADVVEEGENGWVVPIRSAAAIREKLEWLAVHPEHRNSMSKSAARRAREMTWAHYGEVALRMYATLGQRAGFADVRN